MAEPRDPLEARLSGLDAPRPVPPELRQRLEAAIVDAAVPVAADEPDAQSRPIPPDLRRRLETVLVSRRWRGADRPGRQRRLAGLGIAAAALVALASVAIFSPQEGRRSDIVAAPGPQASVTTALTAPPDQEAGLPPSAPAETIPGGTNETVSPTTRPRLASPAPRPSTGQVKTGDAEGVTPSREPADETAPSPSGAEVGGGGRSDPGPPPPFASPDRSGDSSALASPGAPPSGSSSAPAPSAPGTPAEGEPIRIGLVRGDDHEEAGLRAYVETLNGSGGIRGRPIELVATSAGSPAAETLATVNASGLALTGGDGAPAWITGPLLETLTTPEEALARRAGDAERAVFSFASPLERQARLVAEAVFPNASPGATAVVYREVAGPFADRVPSAIAEVLSARGVQVTMVTYDPAKPPLLRDADAAFLSLGTGTADAWLSQARQLGHSPKRGVAGIASLFDPGLLAKLPDGARVLSPYVLPSGQEGSVIASRAGTTSARALHGWTTAKALAIALWRSGADTPVELSAALEELAGHDLGTAPPYETRGGTRSRTPDGILFEVRSGAFVAQGEFRRDPR